MTQNPDKSYSYQEPCQIIYDSTIVHLKLVNICKKKGEKFKIKRSSNLLLILYDKQYNNILLK